MTHPSSEKVVYLRTQLPDKCRCGADLKRSLVAEVFGKCSKCGADLKLRVVRT